ncbi:MAG: hypothetical protein ACTSUE_03340 [Promethearchaeota archaeon]
MNGSAEFIIALEGKESAHSAVIVRKSPAYPARAVKTSPVVLLSMQIEKSEVQQALKRAKEHYFSTGLDDGTSSLCKANMVYGLAKIHYTQEHLGLDPSAFFISTPDETISRNTARWNSGYGYGGKLNWGSGKEKFIVLDVKPNYCGILAGGIDELPEPEHIISRIHDYFSEDLYLDGFKIESDFHKSNHFIDLFKVEPFQDKEIPKNFPEFVFFIHGSCPELREENDKGPGLYYDKSKTLNDMSSSLKTPFGEIKYLLDSDADDFLEYCKYADDFSKMKRRLVGKILFGNFKELANPTHQGLLGYNTIIIGSQNSLDETAPNRLFPLALRGDLPAYLFEGKENLREDVIESLGFYKRAERHDLLEKIKHSNVIPHGGGYKFDDVCSVLRVFTIDNKRFFVCDMENDAGMKIVEDVAALEFSYRGKHVVKKTIELGLGEPVVKLSPKFVLKI